MPVSLWFKDGQLLFDATGKLIFCEECPCGPPAAPCECPCETWLPSSWPCAGLLEEYAVEYYIEDGGYKFRGTGTVTAAFGSGCLWTWSGTSEVDWGEGAGWEADSAKSGNVRIENFPTPCRWVFQIQTTGSLFPIFEKEIGLTPVGSYTEPVTGGTATVS